MIGIKVKNKADEVIFSNTGEKEVTMVYRGKYEKGDSITLYASEYPILLYIRLDDSIAESYIYLTKKEYTFMIPFDDEKKVYGEKAFLGERHWGYARIVSPKETSNYRNLALNTFDTQYNQSIFPHITSNVKQTNPQFYARNVIDGIFETSNHGSYPHGSWGINQQQNAMIKIDFGRKVILDSIVLYIRTDFPHDNWWEKGTVVFSDGSSLNLNLQRTGSRQIFTFAKKQVQWLCLKNLKMSNEPSLYPALSQIEAWGQEV